MIDTPTPFHRQVTKLLEDVSYPGLLLQTYQDAEQRVHVRCHNPAGVCAQTGKPWNWSGRWHRLSDHSTDSEIVATCFHAIITALEHEARESFRFEGQPVYDSHLDVRQLAALRRDEGNLDVRRAA